MEYDLHNMVLQRVALNSQDITTNTTSVGNIVDTAGYESLEFIVTTGSLNAGIFSVTIESGDLPNLSDGALVDAALVLGSISFDDTESDSAFRTGTIAKNRYVRMSVVSTGVTGSNIVSAVAVLGNPHTAPTPAA